MPGKGELLRLVALGHAESRADLARHSGLAPSSVSLRVEELIEAGLLQEEGAGASRGGRRPRRLRLAPQAGLLAIADLGSHHVRLGLADLSGTPLAVVEHPCDIAAGAEPTLDWICDRLEELVAARGDGLPVRGVGIGVPGPVDPAEGTVISPSRMPGWSEYPVRAHLSARFGVPILVENDANLMAAGEYLAWPGCENLMVLKVGTGIGCGIIAGGRLHRGRGAAGDISHVRVRADASVMCSCGHSDCLEAYASGAALMAALAAQGVEVAHPSRIADLAADGVPQATNLVRGAGRLIGDVLTALVNFFNPDAVVIGGSLSAAEQLIAAVRGAVYERCLPLATRDLKIDVTRAGPDAAILGAGSLLLDAVLADAWVEQTAPRP
ncbi:ROK family transcriptional regulator [Sphaerisporangium sp. TRM90804]|uniref:ROK family transcriptional regulator n=1 Tax=Sphaerisporangium sp. TRM90804 TaxID=3031113 RepID=UPI00244A37AF|nr:ROK family transcriptional regulator [Sphaerisporangium sp. TRM90804]MDH2427025.1 ROK family transcriptional regulator [Sphaerisporangium sp. TRM90804]